MGEVAHDGTVIPERGVYAHDITDDVRAYEEQLFGYNRVESVKLVSIPSEYYDDG